MAEFCRGDLWYWRGSSRAHGPEHMLDEEANALSAVVPPNLNRRIVKASDAGDDMK